MNMLRVWPIVCEFGVGAVLCVLGIWAGLRGGYLNLRIAEDRRLLVILIVGYLLLLALMCVFTFLAPHWANGGSL
ncbi:MAG: hypothetical protein JW955_17660 [Sedimentisphaerales bacterium]|nr:hypothetical protein [Sedimentisphaerales bacterium]